MHNFVCLDLGVVAVLYPFLLLFFIALPVAIVFVCLHLFTKISDKRYEARVKSERQKKTIEMLEQHMKECSENDEYQE